MTAHFTPTSKISYKIHATSVYLLPICLIKTDLKTKLSNKSFIIHSAGLGANFLGVSGLEGRQPISRVRGWGGGQKSSTREGKQILEK